MRGRADTRVELNRSGSGVAGRARAEEHEGDRRIREVRVILPRTEIAALSPIKGAKTPEATRPGTLLLASTVLWPLLAAAAATMAMQHGHQ